MSEYVSGKFRHSGENNVISHLYEQITRSLVRIYLGMDCHKANLWVRVALKCSDPIKALIEGKMKERGKEVWRARWRREECLMRPSCTASSASFTHSISPRPSFSIWPNINFTSFFSLCFLSLFSSLVCLFLFSCTFPFSLSLRPVQHTNHIQLNQFKHYNSLTSNRAISISSLLTAQDPF